MFAETIHRIYNEEPISDLFALPHDIDESNE